RRTQKQLARVLIAVQRIGAGIVLRFIEQRDRARIARRQEIDLMFDVLADLAIELADHTEIHAFEQPIIVFSARGWCFRGGAAVAVLLSAVLRGSERPPIADRMREGIGRLERADADTRHYLDEQILICGRSMSQPIWRLAPLANYIFAGDVNVR